MCWAYPLLDPCVLPQRLHWGLVFLSQTFLQSGDRVYEAGKAPAWGRAHAPASRASPPWPSRYLRGSWELLSLPTALSPGVWGFPHQQPGLQLYGHQLGILKSNSVLALSTQRSCQTPQMPSPTKLPPHQTSIARVGHPLSYKAEGSHSPVLRCGNLLEHLVESESTLLAVTASLERV